MTNKDPTPYGHQQFVRILILALALALLLYGVVSGQAQFIFRKAINICFECVGIG